MLITTDKTKRDESARVDFIGQHEVDNVLEDPEYSREFEPILWLLMEEHDMRVDPTMSAEKQRVSGDIGVLTTEFGNWRVALNWSSQWNQGVPPHHYAVTWVGKFGDTSEQEVACLSPYFLARTCPFCKLGNPRPDGREFDMRWMFLHAYMPYNPINGQPTPPDLAAVAPAHRCRGPYYDGRLLGTCQQFDWFGTGVFDSMGRGPREMLQLDAAEALAKATDKDRYATDMAVPDDLEALGLAQDAPTDGDGRIILPGG